MAARRKTRGPVSKKRGARKKPVAKKRAAKKKPAAAKRPARRAAPRPAPARAAIEMNAPNGRPAPSGIGLTHHHMDYTSHDVEAVRRFYVETLGFTNTVHFPEFGYLSVFFSPTSSLGFMAPAPNMPPDSWSPPGEPNLYLYVADVDRAYQQLMARGVAFEMAPTDTPWGHRMAVLRDPEGRRVCLAKDLKRQG